MTAAGAAAPRATAAPPDRPRLRPRGGHRLAPHVVLRADRGLPSGRPRCRRPSASPRSASSTRRPADEELGAVLPRRGGRRHAPAVADGRPAGGRHVRQPGARRPGARRPRGPRLRAELAARARGAAALVAGARHRRRARRRAGARDAAPRSARSAATSRCARSRCADRLRELDFEIPLGWRRPPAADAAPLAPRARRAAARATCPPATRVLPTPTSSEIPALGDQTLRGYLSGSIDVVLRAWSARTRGSWSSTTRPTGSGEPETPADRRRLHAAELLTEAMLHSHYPLQALLYSVVLHRYLRWRLPGYDPGTHLGGILYLYLRGMCGPDTPSVDGQPCGVFGWQPPAALVVALSDLLDGRSSDGGGVMTELAGSRPTTRTTAGFALGAPAAAARLQPGRPARGRRRPRRPAPGRDPGETDERSCSPLALAVPRRPAADRCASTWPRVAEPLDPVAALAGTGGWLDARRREPAGARPRCVPASRAALLYLDRYWREEGQVRDDLVARTDAARAGRRRRQRSSGCSRGCSDDRLRRAARRRRPGRTPVDHRADRWPRHRQDHHGGRPARAARRPARRPPLRIALTAPTGKAAARLQEAVAARPADAPDR